MGDHGGPGVLAPFGEEAEVSFGAYPRFDPWLLCGAVAAACCSIGDMLLSRSGVAGLGPSARHPGRLASEQAAWGRRTGGASGGHRPLI